MELELLTKYAQLAKYLPSPIYKILAQKWVDEKFPRHLFVETTASCNLTCSYCPRERVEQHMDFSTFTSIVDEASMFGPRSFSLHLFGEPLLYPRWHEAIRYIKESNRRHTVLFTTNGTYLNKEIDRLISSNPDKVIWSWRPEAKFTPETKEKLRRWGKFQVRILKQVTPQRAWEEWKDWRPIEVKDLHNYAGNIDLTKFPSKQNSLPKRWPCYHLWLAPAVAWNGNILMCCNLPHHEEVLGHFPEQSIAEVWQGERLKSIRESHLNGKYPGICQGCDVWKTYPSVHFKWQGIWWNNEKGK